ncbi:DUF3349 domain-containing protein [Nocardia sp. NPDC052254]|uniref:DUF3349 domain-containing protein n=1 Tax=Nocardia sp. NPDC052254 TaxID=3155681 RepID=UPI003447FECB
MTSNTSVVESVLHWLRAGYPHGVPGADYVALFAVLHRKLTEHEVGEIAEQLVEGNGAGAVTRAEIESAIATLALERPADDDVKRVAARLVAGGWPLADPADA